MKFCAKMKLLDRSLKSLMCDIGDVQEDLLIRTSHDIVNVG